MRLPSGSSTPWKIVGAVALGFGTLLGVSIAARVGGETPSPATAIGAAAVAKGEAATAPPAPTTQPSGGAGEAESVSPLAVAKGALRPGSYAVSRFDPDFAFAVDRGWRSLGDKPEIVQLRTGKGRNLTVLRAPLYVFDYWSGATVPAPADMLGWMRAHPCVTQATKSAPVTVGGNRGTGFDFVVSPEPACARAYWEIGDGLAFNFEAGERDRLIALSVDAGGSLNDLLIDVSTVDPSQFDAFVRRAANVLATIRFR